MRSLFKESIIMKKFQLRSIILGIGIGIVITSIISMIFFAGLEPKQSLSNEEIINMASELGMVKKSQFFDSSASDGTLN